MSTKDFQQLDEVNNRIELKKGDWRLLLKCCDCGLVHKMAFAVEDNGNLGIAIKRESNVCTEPNCKNGMIKLNQPGGISGTAHAKRCTKCTPSFEDNPLLYCSDCNTKHLIEQPCLEEKP